MSDPVDRPRPGPLVTAVLVCHDGAAWLPEALDAIAGQTRPPDRLVIVDTGSQDGSADLAAARFPAADRVVAGRDVGFGAAVAAGLHALGPGAPESADAAQQWVWLLHDDAAPDPDALAELLNRVDGAPSIWLVGPKLRFWDGQRLQSAGLSVDLAGYVDAGMDGAELDQGQRDDVDDVLAVGTAGALVRRPAWDGLGGMDPGFALYADDIDLGWRVNLADGRVVVASRAVVRHAAGLGTARRAADAVTGRPSVVRRRHGMQVVLVNTAGYLLPLLVARYVVSSLLRSVALLVFGRRPGAAADEVRATAGVIRRLPSVLAARRERRQQRLRRHRELRRLFPSPGTRWRHAAGSVGLSRLVGSRRPTAAAAHESGPVSEEAESLAGGDSVVLRLLARPPVLMVVVLSVLAVVADRSVLSSALHGGRLLPAPAGARDLWSSYLATWHPAGVGSATPMPPSVAVLAALSTIFAGKPWLVVDVLVLGAVPLAALSAYTALRTVTRAVNPRVWVAVTYSLLPAVTGAVAGGRIDVVVTALIAPLAAAAAAGAIRRASQGDGWHRAAGAGLLLGLTAAFAPVLWLLAVAVMAVAVAATGPDRARRALAAVVVAVVPLLVLVPWTWHVVRTPTLLVSGSGLPETFTAAQPPAGWLLALLHAGGPAQPPFWVGVAVLAAAVLGLRRASHVAEARIGGLLLVAGIGWAIAQTRTPDVTAGTPASRYWPGLALLVAGAGGLLAATVAVVGARPALRSQSFGWRQPAAVAVVVLGMVSTATLAGSWLVRGAATPLEGGSSATVPLFAQAEMTVPTAPRALILARSGADIHYTLVRRPTGPQLGDGDVLPDARSPSPVRRADSALTAAVRDLVAGVPSAGPQLASFGIGYVVVPAGTAGRLAVAIGRTGEFTLVPTAGARVWRTSQPAGQLSVLTPTDARAALSGRTGSGAGATLLPSAVDHADAAVAAGPPGRLAVLADPADGQWRASIAGHALPRRTAYGWAESFELPASGGRLQLSYRGSGWRGGWLAVELGLLLVVVLASLPARRRPEPVVV